MQSESPCIGRLSQVAEGVIGLVSHVVVGRAHHGVQDETYGVAAVEEFSLQEETTN